MKVLKKIPNFKDEKSEMKFWEFHNSSEYIDWERASKARFPNLKKSTKKELEEV